MATLLAQTCFSHTNGMNPGTDSAYSLLNAGMLARPRFAADVPVRFGGEGDVGNIVGQSYERGTHPPR